MSERHERADAAIRELVAANHILAREGVVDALGHVSSRHPEHPERYLLSCSRSPALVSKKDIMEFDLRSRESTRNKPIDQRGRPVYVERPINGAVDRARPDVGAICHGHAHPLIPFGVTGVPLRLVFVLGATVGEEVPVWDIREDFPDDGGMLGDRALAHRPCGASGRAAVLSDRRLDPWASVVGERRAGRAAPARAQGRSQAPLRAASAAPPSAGATASLTLGTDTPEFRPTHPAVDAIFAPSAHKLAYSPSLPTLGVRVAVECRLTRAGELLHEGIPLPLIQR
jgi:hypothetical protein